MEKNALYGIALILCLVLTACACKHEWKNATCTKPKTCTKCNETEGEPLGHAWIDATCTEAKTCSRCGLTEGEPLGHQVSEWAVTTEPTCTTKGARTGSCEICHESVTEAIDIIAHTPGDWSVTTEPTEDKPGEKTQYCTVCGAVIATEAYELSAEEIEQQFKDKCTVYSYETIARDPESYNGTYGCYTGKVIQAMESTLYGLKTDTLRINITKTSYSYTDTIYVTYTASTDASRILEDDIVTIWGINKGTTSYETVLGATVTLPMVQAKYLEIN